MENEEITVDNLENITPEELELALSRDDNSEDEAKSTDWEAKAKHAENKSAMLQRLLNKKDKTINKTNTNTELEKDIAEIKLSRKVDRFAEENNLSRAQAEKVFKLNPNPTAEFLKDPFIASGLQDMTRRDRVDNAMSGGVRTPITSSKPFAEMTDSEKQAWYVSK